MEDWIKKHPFLAIALGIVIGALFFAAPIALVVVKVKSLISGGHTLPAGSSKAQETVASKANA